MRHLCGTRRKFILTSSRFAAGIILLGALPSNPRAQAKEGINWREAFARTPQGGEGHVKTLQGTAFANDRPLKVGDVIKSGTQLRLAKGGSLVVSVSRGAIFQLKGETTMEFNASTMNTGLFRLVAGALVAVVPRGGRFLVQGPTATIGIKGTVVYRQIFKDHEKIADAGGGKTYTRPAELTDYFCTCNGSVDFLRNTDRSVVRSDTAEHHNAFFMGQAVTPTFMKAPMINHFDVDLEKLIDQQEGEKHDRSFLKPM